MIPLDPKSQFIQWTPEDQREAFTRFMSQPLARNAAIYALALITTKGASKEQLDGARLFADVFMNLAEPQDEMPVYPTKALRT